MDGELLWNRVYRVVRKVAASFSATPHRGHPDVYGIEVVAICWLWAAFRNRPLVHAVNELRSPRQRRLLELCGFMLPAHIPHETTIRRRAKRPDFTVFLQAVDRRLRRRLEPRHHRCLIDSTPLPLRLTSHDPDATWGGGKVYGYRWHTLTSSDRVVLAAELAPANVHELTIAPRLVKSAAAQGIRARWLIGDRGFDSESLHGVVRHEFRGRLIAPFNRRRGAKEAPRTPHRVWLAARWKRPDVRGGRRLRGEIDRMYSVFKSGEFGLYSLPPWVRHCHNVARWVELKRILYHANLTLQRRKRVA